MKLLILGCARSGTSLLCSMLGRHSEINMLCESFTDDINKLYGKKYQANKLVLPDHIRMNLRASKLTHLINRAVNLNIRPHKYRLFPLSGLSISDYQKQKAKVICIQRNRNKNVQSMINRSKLPCWYAEYQYDRANRIISEIKDCFTISFESLVKNPETVMIEICNYLEIIFDFRMLEGYKFNKKYKYSKILAEKA